MPESIHNGANQGRFLSPPITLYLSSPILGGGAWGTLIFKPEEEETEAWTSDEA